MVLVRLVRGLAVLMGIGLAISIISIPFGGGLGDRSLSVTFVNETTQRVNVYPYGRGYEAGRRVIEPGETGARDNLLANGTETSHMAHVEAFGDDGTLVFCHDYTVGEMRSLAGVVSIRAGQNDCR